MRWSLATIALVPRGETRRADRDERRRVFRWGREAGFAGIEISPHWLDFVGLNDAELREVRQDAAAEGLVVSGVNVNRCIVVRSGRSDAHFNLLRRAIEAADCLGAPVVTISQSLPLAGASRPPVRGTDFSELERTEAADRISHLAHFASQRGVFLSLELHDDGLLDTAGKCLDMLRRVNAANLGVNPDLGNLIRSEHDADWKTSLERLAPRANNWHVKNYRAGESAPVWDGQIDYREAFRIMREAGYNGWVSIESYFGD